MSELTAQITVTSVREAVATLRAAKLGGVVLPIQRGAVIVAPWEDWDKVHAAFAESWRGRRWCVHPSPRLHKVRVSLANA